MGSTFVFCLIAFLSGVLGLVSSDPQLRTAGIVLAACALGVFLLNVLMDYVQELREAAEDRNYISLHREERLNDLEVWREETAPEIQFTKDKIANLEQRESAMSNCELASLWPVVLGLIVSALYFLIKSKRSQR